MVTVSSAFMSSRRERIRFRVLSASGCACKTTAGVDVLRVFGKPDLDNTDVARDHSFHCIAIAESWRALPILHCGCGVNGFNIPVTPSCHFALQLPSGFRSPVDDRLNFIPVRKTQAGGGRSASLPA